MRYLDITGTMAEGMWSYGATMAGVPPFEHRRWATIANQGFENDWFAFRRWPAPIWKQPNISSPTLRVSSRCRSTSSFSTHQLP
ncbi:MAG: hypothetical protein R2839_00075 [Thermomicrobiales bacterium]